jgi:quercetin dioxygenase-like cupin family protein
MIKGMCVAAAAAMLVGGGAVQAKPGHSSLKWMAGPPGLPEGSQMAVVSGNPGKAEIFTVNLKFPAGYAVPAHSHPTAEHLTVLSGKVGYGMSDKLDKGKAKWAKAGGHMTMGAKMNHWVFASAPAELQIRGMGPFVINYVDPKDDPRNK